MLGKIIDTALAAPDRPFERRPRFIDDAAHNDYMSRLAAHGKKAMDAELHDATYGDDAPTPKQRIALAKLRTRAWKGDVKAQKALNALASKTALVDGWSIKPWKWGKKSPSAQDVRLAKMRAAQKRLQASRAKAAAADAETEAEQRTQQAIADAADAEADAADAEAAAKQARMQTAEAEANPDSIPSADADIADAAQGWGFRSAFRKVGRGLKKAGHMATMPLSMAARFVPGRDTRKARLVRNTYRKMWYEHANWLAIQDKNAGLPLKPRADYEYVAKLWAKQQMKKNKLPTNFAVTGADILGAQILGPGIMGSWFWPFGNFLNFARTTVNNTADKRADAPPEEQQSDAEQPDYSADAAALNVPPSDGPPDDGSGDDYEFDPDAARQLAASTALQNPQATASLLKYLSR
jgi:hypothetical protein